MLDVAEPPMPREGMEDDAPGLREGALLSLPPRLQSPKQVQIQNAQEPQDILETSCVPQSATVVKVLESCFHDVCQWF